MVAHDLEKNDRTEDIAVEDGVMFSTMLLPDFILRGLNSAGFKKPSPIQLAAIPLARCGLDLIVQAKSGTGKTLVFAITALESVNLSIKRVQVIILAPTREIAFQIADVIRSIGSSFKGLKVGTFVGGRSINSDKPDLNGCHIAVGSPGRIRHLIELKTLDSKAVRLFVLDEADKLFEKALDYQHDLNYIFNNCGESKQVLALSATYPPELLEFTQKYMRSGQHVTPSGGPTPVLLGLRQMVLISRDHPDYAARLSIKEKELINILEMVSFDQCCVFCNYATRAESINFLLMKKGFASICLTGKQEMEKRIEAITTFKSGGCRILVTTDLAARGIDASCINLVINCEVPYDGATYLHRMGRAGRYGSHGLCISIISDGIELDKFRKLLGTIGGTSMHVNVIPRLRKVDLWTEDLSNFDKIQGLVESNEEGTLEEQLKSNFQTASEYMKNNCKESIYLYKKDDIDGQSASNVVQKDTQQSVSLKQLEEELNSYLLDSVKPIEKTAKVSTDAPPVPATTEPSGNLKVSTPRKSTPIKKPTYSEIVINARGKNPVAKKSLPVTIAKGQIRPVLTKIVEKEKDFKKVPVNNCKKENIGSIIQGINEARVCQNASEHPLNLKADIKEKPVAVEAVDIKLEKLSINESNANVTTSSSSKDNEHITKFPLKFASSAKDKVDGNAYHKRKRSVSSEGVGDDFDTYTYTIESTDYETIEDDSSVSGIDLNSNPEDFESLSDITPLEEESEVDYPSEIFRFSDEDDEKNESSPQIDWFAVIAKEIQNYVVYSRQFMNANNLAGLK